MIKDILVHIPTERPLRPVVDASISLATAFGAHIDATAIGYISTGTAYVMDGSAAGAVAAVFEMEQRRAAERSAAALAIFEAEARSAGISYGCSSIEDLSAEAASTIGVAARLYDLAVVQQPDAAQEAIDNAIPTAILLHAGGPCVVRASHLPRHLQAQAHRNLLGWKPARRSCAEGCQAISFAGGHCGHDFDQ
jgi:hypothetical protein